MTPRLNQDIFPAGRAVNLRSWLGRWHLAVLLIKMVIIVVVGVVLVVTDRGSYRRRAQPVYDALRRLNAYAVANRIDAAYDEHLAEADSAYHRWRDTLRPDEMLRDSEQALTLAFLDYKQLSRLRASGPETLASADQDAPSVERERLAADAASNLKKAGELLNAGN